jgi:thiosulfate/3-mercaptopyruvate sulfurtransferase
VTFPLVSCTDLAVSLSGAEPLVLVDVRWRLGGPPGREDYARGHLPGAVYLDLDTDLAAPPGLAGRHPLPEPADLQRVLRAAGVREGGPVVVYDADNGSVAARLWWLLRWAGHAQVRLLDGGYAAWVAEGHPVTTDVPTPAPGDVTVRPGHMPVVDADGAAELARTGVLLDARAPERYRGEVEPIDPKAGHVPGARNAPFAAHTDETGRWRTPEELTNHFAKLGVPTAGIATAGFANGGGVGEAAAEKATSSQTRTDGPAPRAGDAEPLAEETELSAGSTEPRSGGTELRAGGTELRPGGTEPRAGGTELLADGARPLAEAGELSAGGVDARAGTELLAGGAGSLEGARESSDSGMELRAADGAVPPAGGAESAGGTEPPAGGAGSLADVGELPAGGAEVRPGGAEPLVGGAGSLTGAGESSAGGPEVRPGGAGSLADVGELPAGGPEVRPGGPEQLADGAEQSVGGAEPLVGGAGSSAGVGELSAGGAEARAGGAELPAGGVEQSAGGTVPQADDTELSADGAGSGGVGLPVVGAYCGSGVTAASVVLALEVAGVTSPAAPAALYAGSWSNWSADAGRPVATGDEPV